MRVSSWGDIMNMRCGDVLYVMGEEHDGLYRLVFSCFVVGLAANEVG